MILLYQLYMYARVFSAWRAAKTCQGHQQTVRMPRYAQDISGSSASDHQSSGSEVNIEIIHSGSGVQVQYYVRVCLHTPNILLDVYRSPRPDKTRPDQTRPDQTRSHHATLRHVRPDQTRLDQTRPDQITPRHATPRQTRPDSEHSEHIATGRGALPICQAQHPLPRSTHTSGCGLRGAHG